jgi:tetratricopeptide (TPR) repeat protein
MDWPKSFRDALAQLKQQFVGREQELARLRAALEDAARGQGRVVFLVGDPGIGKTRTVRELAARFGDSECAWYSTCCEEDAGAPPLWPWIRVLRDCAKACDPEELATEPAIADLVAGHSWRPADRHSERAHSPETQAELFGGITAFLDHLATRQPLVLFLDDLHAADKPSLRLLRHLVRQLGDKRVLLLASYRDVEVEDTHPLAELERQLRRERAYDRVLLGGLSESEVLELLCKIGGQHVPRRFARAICTVTEGNPFYIEELLRDLFEKGILRHDGTRWTSDVDINQMPLSGTREFRRLAHISDECRATLGTAAAIGPEFSLDILERVTEMDRHHVLSMLDEATGAGIVDALGGVVLRYRFRHPLFREALYRDLPSTRRLELHRRIGDVLETRYTDILGPRSAELAFHFAHAGPTADCEKGIQYAVRAAEWAEELRVHEEAARYYDWAVQFARAQVPSDSERLGLLLLRKGRSVGKAGDIARSQSIAREVVTIARATRDRFLLARAALGYAGRVRGLGWVGVDQSVIDLLEEALRALGDEETALKAQIMARLAEEIAFVASRERCSRLATAAVDLAHALDDPTVEASVLGSMHWALWAPEQAEERLRLAQKIKKLAAVGRDQEMLFEGHLAQCLAQLELGDAGIARATFVSCERLAQALREPRSRWMAALVAVCLAFAEGRLDHVEPLAREACKQGRETDPGTSEFYMGIQVGHLLWLRGRFDELRSWLEVAEADYPMLSPIARSALAATYAEEGREAEAQRELDRVAKNAFFDLPRTAWWVPSLAFLAIACAALQDATRARQVYGLLLPFARCNVMLPPLVCFGSTSHFLGILAATVGCHEDARRHFDEALSMNRSAGAEHWVAHTHVQYAEMLLRFGDPADQPAARAFLSGARQAAERLGLITLCARVDGLWTTIPDAGTQTLCASADVSPAADLRRTPVRCSLRPEGKSWKLVFGSEVFLLPERRGLSYLVPLLAAPGEEIDVLVLLMTANGRVDIDLLQEEGRDLGPVIDRTTIWEVSARRRELVNRLSIAQETRDDEHASEIEEELKELDAYTRSACRSPGKIRHQSNPAKERARQCVTKGINVAIEVITEACPLVGRHLRVAVKTGLVCSYTPDPLFSIRWET